jgi:hypothetical protein
MHGPAPHRLHDHVAGALEVEAALHRGTVDGGQLHRVLAAEEVRRVQQVDV